MQPVMRQTGVRCMRSLAQEDAHNNNALHSCPSFGGHVVHASLQLIARRLLRRQAPASLRKAKE
jgi:hypothetical protein